MSFSRTRLLVAIGVAAAFPVFAAAAAGPRPDSKPPSAPTGLSVMNTTAVGGTIGWTKSKDNVGVAGYYVYVNGKRYATTAGP